jgi:hypothetical protein
VRRLTPSAKAAIGSCNCSTHRTLGRAEPGRKARVDD